MQTVKTPRITRRIRRMTVCRYAFRGVNSRTATSFPALRLAGKWLQDSGFKPGHVVDIACEKGRLTITLTRGQALQQAIIITCSLSINQRDFDYTPRPDLLILLTVYMNDIKSVLYLIPSIVFTTPDNIFLVNEQPGALRHFSTWQIKVFTKAIETLSHYTLDAVNEL